MQGAKKELAETCPENMVVWTEPVDHGWTLVSGCIGCWDDMLDGSCCWGMIERMNIVTLKRKLRWKVQFDSLFFIDESWIPWSDTPTQWNQQDLASQIFTSHKRLHDRLHMLHQKLLARSLPTVTSTTQRLRLGQLKTTKLPTSPLINAGCSGVRPMSEQIWFWKRYLVNELQLRWMHYHW